MSYVNVDTSNWIEIQPRGDANINDIEKWLSKNCQGGYYNILWNVGFELKADAMMFKLRWL